MCLAYIRPWAINSCHHSIGFAPGFGFIMLPRSEWGGGEGAMMSTSMPGLNFRIVHPCSTSPETTALLSY